MELYTWVKTIQLYTVCAEWYHIWN